MEKKISYLSKTFTDIQSDLIKLSNKYYPDMSSSYDDKSVGSWFIDLCSSVGDDLCYSIDRAAQESTLDSSNLKSTVLNIARENGIKVPGSKASLCEVEISCVMPIDSSNISSPDWKYSPIVKRASQVACGAYVFELQEDVNFSEQFNSEGYSNRTYTPRRSTNGLVTAYTVTKTTTVVAGTSKIYRKTISNSDLSSFMEIVLPETNVMNVEGVIFKSDSSYNKTPNLSEFYVSNEEYRWADESVNTYKFFEVKSLSDQYVFAPSMVNSAQTDVVSTVNSNPIYNCSEEYVDYSNSGDVYSRIYKGEWKAIRQKFITEYTDNGYLKLIFGSGNNYENVPKEASTYSKWQMSKLINNDMLGVLPEAGWIMYCLYKVGGGEESNVAANSINTWVYANMEWACSNLPSTGKSMVTKSLTVNNPTSSIAGKDAPSVEEMKYLIKYNVGAQERCVSLKDYKARLMMMPPKYGCPYRASVIEENNKILMYLLTVKNDGTLDNKIPSTLTDNIKEYMSMYKSLGDYLEIRSGYIINLGFVVNVFIDKTYTTSSVVANIINKVKDYMSIESHDIGDSIFLGDLEKEITLIDGVISIIDFETYNLYGDNDTTYGVKSSLPKYVNRSTNICEDSTTETFPNIKNSFRIDTDSLDRVLTNDADTMFEIKYPSTDIKIRVKLR
jgi:hypothetical protein